MKRVHGVLLLSGLLFLTGCSKGEDADNDDAANGDDDTTAVINHDEAPAPSDSAVLLDGKTFAVTGSEQGKEESENDTLNFANGMFRSKGCDQYGFKEASYTSTKEGDATHFTAVAESATEGKIAWDGRVTGETIEGTYVWTKEGQAAITYTFQGSQVH